LSRDTRARSLRSLLRRDLVPMPPATVACFRTAANVSAQHRPGPGLTSNARYANFAGSHDAGVTGISDLSARPDG
jgi:hypothetical protein